MDGEPDVYACVCFLTYLQLTLYIKSVYVSKAKGYRITNVIKNMRGQWRTVCCVLLASCHGDSHNNITAACLFPAHDTVEIKCHTVAV